MVISKISNQLYAVSGITRMLVLAHFRILREKATVLIVDGNVIRVSGNTLPVSASKCTA